MIERIEGQTKAFFLHTAHTTYAFRVTETGHLEQLHYGRRIHADDVDGLVEQQQFLLGNAIAYDEAHPALALEDVCLELSSWGKGDTREPFLEVVFADGSRTTDFLFETDVTVEGDMPNDDVPTAYGCDDHLMLTLRDQNHGLLLELHYMVFEAADVITRAARLINATPAPVRIERLLSMQLDLREKGLFVHTFHGAWTKEMCHDITEVTAGKFSHASVTGTSSNRCNPFFMAHRAGCSEEHGECFAFNLIYSGNHYAACEVSPYDKTRIVSGIHPETFSYLLDARESFTTPEAVMTYSARGFAGASRHMHAFVNRHIVRGYWQKKERPLLLNSWEANYFDINERKLLSLAKKAKEAGVELFVMDDGWFGERSDDKRALGDWTVNKKKLPGGLLGLAEKLRAMGLSFGLWIEPEMVNTDSDLYRAHPDWAIDIPDMAHAEGRNQRLLDFANPAVVNHMTEAMTLILEAAPIAYIKWDMNRIFSDYYSRYLPAERQGEVAYRYMAGVYRLMRALTKKFPKVLFEGCASGGNRFDLGALCYFPQIWASDNTDAISRLRIQDGYSYGYPQSTYTAHVSSCPNHQTLRVSPLNTRFAVASCGVLGYECNFVDMTKDELEEIKTQIALYKKYRQMLQFGSFYRHRAGNFYEWSIVSEDQKTAWGVLVQKETMPGERYADFHARGLAPEKRYHFFGQKLTHSIKIFGDLLNTVTPIHVRPNSMVHHAIDKFVPMEGETEDHHMYGDALMYAGVRLRQGYVGTGFDDHVRVMGDYGARLYIMEEEA